MPKNNVQHQKWIHEETCWYLVADGKEDWIKVSDLMAAPFIQKYKLCEAEVLAALTEYEGPSAEPRFVIHRHCHGEAWINLQDFRSRWISVQTV